MKKLVLLVGLALALVPTSGAAAAAPVITHTTDQISQPIPFGIDCGSFKVLVAFEADGANINFDSDTGQLVKQIRHVQFSGTLSNSSDLAKSVTYEGDFTRTWDVVANTTTFTGVHFKVLVPGQGILALDTAREVYQPAALFVSDQIVPIFVAGNNDFAAFKTELCSALG
ncbi:MAG TPA: hypothetical protein VE441_08800 [Mycobacterium sp.]|jgi:hypothetical protein|nr:hypothetical protein [Mycobacterium sp.]